MTVQLPFSPLPGADQPGGLAEAVQADLDALAQSVPASAVRLKGQVDGTGARIAGTGFSSARQVAGAYIVTFTQPFPAVPLVQVTVTSTGGGPLMVRTGSKTTTGFGVSIYSDTGAATDAGFDFVAETP